MDIGIQIHRFATEVQLLTLIFYSRFDKRHSTGNLLISIFGCLSKRLFSCASAKLATSLVTTSTLVLQMLITCRGSNETKMKVVE